MSRLRPFLVLLLVCSSNLLVYTFAQEIEQPAPPQPRNDVAEVSVEVSNNPEQTDAASSKGPIVPVVDLQAAPRPDFNLQEVQQQQERPHGYGQVHIDIQRDQDGRPVFTRQLAFRDNRVVRHGNHNHTVQDTVEHSGFIVSVMLVTILVAQLGLYVWKSKHPSSYEMSSLAGLWLLPLVWSLRAGFWRMILIWSAFSAATSYVLRLATRKPLQRTTPRRVYLFFAWVYRCAFATTFIGYLFLVAEMAGFSVLLGGWHPADMAAVLMFYGLYFGVLGRDLAAACSTRMASTMGYRSSKDEVCPSRHLAETICAICDSPLHGPPGGEREDARSAARERESALPSVGGSRSGSAGGVVKPERTIKLNCGHQFHDLCLRGWTLIGKKNTCAYCNEKVSLRSLYFNPWDAAPLVWSMLLDLIRYMVVFNPMVFFVMQHVLEWVY